MVKIGSVGAVQRRSKTVVKEKRRRGSERKQTRDIKRKKDGSRNQYSSIKKKIFIYS